MDDIEAIMNFEVSDTTLRRRDEWIDAGVFDQLETEARAGYDRVIGLDLSHVAIDASLHKALYGGEGTGHSPVDRAKLRWKWSVAVDGAGIPIGWAIDGANRNDVKLLEPTHVGSALDRRSHQLLVVELRPTPTKHRPTKPMEPRNTTYRRRP